MAIRFALQDLAACAGEAVTHAPSIPTPTRRHDSRRLWPSPGKRRALRAVWRFERPSQVAAGGASALSGGGFRGTDGLLHFDTSAPSPAGEAWDVRALSDSNLTSNFDMYVICANV